MVSKSYTVIGLMSGTSGDGLDLTLARFTKSSSWSYEILAAETALFPPKLEGDLMQSHLLSAVELALLDVSFGKWMGNQVNTFTAKVQAKPDAVCSHGHTVFHQPNKELSLQIGNGWAIHRQTGLKVINDFRMLDVQFGGQGAPLVPVGDQLLFPDQDFCINLGGIANISMDYQSQRIAFDTCPFNLLLNEQARKLGKNYDDQGKWASEGGCDESLLNMLNDLPYYKHTAAKSLAREDLEVDFNPLIRNSGLDPKSILATLVRHYAFQIGKVIRFYSSSQSPKVLLTGGGAYHTFFIQELTRELEGKIWLYPADRQLIEFKEALVFGFLGVLRLAGQNNCLRTVTGASQDSSGGMIFG
jgi:anhydro-N-acetylmuramic acid kinase